MRWSVPRLWPGETVCLLGSGPSMAHTQWDLLKGARTIAINYKFRAWPWADVVYFTDFYPFYRSVEHTIEFKRFKGLKVTIAPQLLDHPSICVLRKGEERGLSLDPATLNHGANSGFAALNLAVLLGATKIVLLGFDMKAQGNRTHDDHYHVTGPQPQTFPIWQRNFASVVPILETLGVAVVNVTPDSALDCFPKYSLQEALTWQS